MCRLERDRCCTRDPRLFLLSETRLRVSSLCFTRRACTICVLHPFGRRKRDKRFSQEHKHVELTATLGTVRGGQATYGTRAEDRRRLWLPWKTFSSRQPAFSLCARIRPPKAPLPAARIKRRHQHMTLSSAINKSRVHLTQQQKRLFRMIGEVTTKNPSLSSRACVDFITRFPQRLGPLAAPRSTCFMISSLHSYDVIEPYFRE